MNASDFDRFSRAFGLGLTRRGVAALLAGLLVARTRTAASAQLAPAACGQSGAVCTLIMGCCEGFTCVTSAINVNYGVCVPGGSGGTVTGTTSLISPQSDGVVDQLAGATTTTTPTTSTTSTTDKEAEKQARIAQRKARKRSHRSAVRSRRSDQQSRRKDQQRKRALARGPKLQLKLFNPGAEETVKVINLDSVSIVLSQIQMSELTGITDSTSLSPVRQLGPGNSFLFRSGVPLGPTDDPHELAWRNQPVCNGNPGQGFIVVAGYNSSSENHEYEILCDGPSVVTFGAGKGNKHKNRQRRRNRKHKSRKNT